MCNQRVPTVIATMTRISEFDKCRIKKQKRLTFTDINQFLEFTHICYKLMMMTMMMMIRMRTMMIHLNALGILFKENKNMILKNCQ